MVIAQRGTAAVNLNTTTQFAVDRFFAYADLTATAQQISSISLDGFKNALRVQRTAGQTSTNNMIFGQTLESDTSIPLQGKAVTLSFWARAGANFSASSNTLTARLYTGTGTNQGGLAFNWTGAATPINQGVTLTTSWQRFSVTGTVATTATQAQIFLFYTPTGTAGAADSVDITGVQLEIGSVATAFQTATGTIQGELAACQRYYWRLNGSGYSYFCTAANRSTTVTDGTIFFPVTMRTSPTLSFSAGNTFMNYENGSIIAGTAISADSGTLNTYGISLTVASGLTAGRAGTIRANNTSAYVDFSSEL